MEQESCPVELQVEWVLLFEMLHMLLHAIIANILEPFPEGQKVCQFAAFKHTNTQHLHIDATGPQTYYITTSGHMNVP
jgi:hypothetical protein